RGSRGGQGKRAGGQGPRPGGQGPRGPGGGQGQSRGPAPGKAGGRRGGRSRGGRSGGGGSRGEGGARPRQRSRVTARSFSRYNFLLTNRRFGRCEAASRTTSSGATAHRARAACSKKWAREAHFFFRSRGHGVGGGPAGVGRVPAG